MIGRTSLMEQKRIQWAQEREEMARMSATWGPFKPNNYNCTHIRHYGSTASLKSLTTESSGNGNINLKCLDYNSGSLINLQDQTDALHIRRRSPSLPPIFNKEQQQYFSKLEQQREFDVDGSRYQTHRSQKQEHRPSDRRAIQKEHQHYSASEEREGETSGYASDSVDPPTQGRQKLLPDNKSIRMEMMEETCQNPYSATSDSSLPPSRLGELNRPRWGGVWDQETSRSDPPPPSWLSRLGQSSQVLVINHDSASSPDSSTTGSTGSDINKTYLRGQNIPVDADILQERETRRQKALELQNAIKQQLEEREKQRKQEKERRIREEILEEERIKREREKEKKRFEEEQRIIREKEAAKLRKAETMREMLEAAERSAKEKKKNRWKRDEACVNTDVIDSSSNDSNAITSECKQNESQTVQNVTYLTEKSTPKDTKEADNYREIENNKEVQNCTEKPEEALLDIKSVQVPVSKEVAIVLSGRLDDPEILGKANFQLVNLMMTPSPRKYENTMNSLSFGLNTIMRNGASPRNVRNYSSTIVENRLLTPSKYRTSAGRDFGTQTDTESDLQELRDKLQETSIRDGSTKERKDTTNANRKNVEKSTNIGPSDEISMKMILRSKSRSRHTLDARPRWNANRPGTRYRTQSEKDPHYQRRLQLRRRQIESSDERSRSPSPERRKLNNGRLKNRNIIRRKIDNYDADLSMDSLNSVIPLRIDSNGKINIDYHRKVQSDNSCNDVSHVRQLENDNSNNWCGHEILSRLSSLRSVMAFQLEDLLRDDKKDANLIPDLSKATCNSHEEYRRLKEQCPEFKIKAEKVKREDTKVRDKEFSWKVTKKELKAIERNWAYGNPVPPDMRGLNLQELQQVAIDWRMLTSIRPKLRQDEEMFSRLVEMGKLQAKTIIRERRSSISPIRRNKNRAGIIESAVKTCRECGEEYCFGEFCRDILYDSFIRITITTQTPKIKISADTEAIIAKMDRKKKRKKKKKTIKNKSRISKRSPRLLINGKARKSITDFENKNTETKTRYNNVASNKPVKQFKRKCSKRAKKGLSHK